MKLTKQNLSIMKNKIILLLLIGILSFSFTAFRGCMFNHFVFVLTIYMTQNGRYIYGDVNPLDYNIMVGANGNIVRSINDNNNITYTNIPSGTTQNLNDVRISNNFYQDDAAIAGNNGTVLVSSNSGLNWITKSSPTTANLYGIDHSYYLYAVGDNGTILYASEIFTGSLVQQTSGTTRNLKAVTISNLNTQRVIAVGEKGTILRTTNGGFNWVNVSIADTTVNFYDLSQKGIFYNTGDIFVAVGSGGKIYKTTDNGLTWQQKNSGTTNTLRSVYFQTLDSGVVVGDNGTVRMTTNGGETWFTDPFFNSPSTRNYRFVSLVNNTFRTFMAGSDSLFYVSNDPVTFTGVTLISSEVPDQFSLNQNYPNPFNPVTNIVYSVSSSGNVKITVYDINGREISVLTDEFHSPGIYKTEWNALAYTSGVYFYRIEAEGFTDTKKMMLIK